MYCFFKYIEVLYKLLLSGEDWIEVKKESYYKYISFDNNVLVYDDGYKVNEKRQQFYSGILYDIRGDNNKKSNINVKKS